MEISFNPETKKYWTSEDIVALETIETLVEMHAIAARVLERMPAPVIEVCGPISTGGLGSIEANMQAFKDTIRGLQDKGMSVFDQMPFEVPMKRLKQPLVPGEYLTAILTDFYQPILESGKIHGMYFMPDWQSSYGARWEHEQAERLGIPITYL